MTSQSNDNNFSKESDSRQNDFDLTDLVPEPNAEVANAEEKFAELFDDDGDCIKSSQPANSTEGEGTPSIQVDNLPNADGSRVDKSAKRDRPVSLWRDAAFLRDLEGFLASQQSSDSMGTSVSSHHTVPDFLISYPSLTQLTQILRRVRGQPEPRAGRDRLGGIYCGLSRRGITALLRNGGTHLTSSRFSTVIWPWTTLAGFIRSA